MGVDIVERLKRAQVTRATYTMHGVDFEGFASPVVGERDSNAELDFVVEVFKDCAAEIERLRAERDEYKDAFEFAHKEFHDALDDLAKMKAELCTALDKAEGWKAERDHARREICERIAALAPSMSAAQIARERGWDCYPRKQPRKPKGATNGG